MEKTTEQDRINLNRLEASIPVQSRVNITDLANLTSYWEGEGYRVRTMSQLLSWSMSLLVDILEKNELMKNKIETAAEANKYLELMRLYQPSMKAKGFKRVAAAVRFEGMRAEGMNPAIDDPYSFSAVHNKHSMDSAPIVKLSQEEVRAQWRREQTEKKQHTNTIDDNEWDSIQKRLKEEKEKDRLKELEIAKNSNYCIRPGEELKEGMSDEELAEYNRKRDAEIIARENAPMSEEDMKSAIVKDDSKFE